MEALLPELAKYLGAPGIILGLTLWLLNRAYTRISELEKIVIDQHKEMNALQEKRITENNTVHEITRGSMTALHAVSEKMAAIEKVFLGLYQVLPKGRAK